MTMKKLIALVSLVLFLGVSIAPVVASGNNEISIEVEKKCPKCGKENCDGKCDTKATTEKCKTETKTAECKTSCTTSCEEARSECSTEKKSSKEEKKKKEGGR